MDDFVRRPKRSLLDVRQTPVPVYVSADSSEGAGPPEMLPPLSTPSGNAPQSPKTPKKPGKFAFKLPRKLPVPKTKLQWIIFCIVVALLLAGSGLAVYWFILRDTTPPPPVVVQQEPEPEPEPEPTTGPSVVSGREVPLSEVQKPIYAVQIENSPEARPQSGLVDADIVSEAIAEGGITRFNAIYHDKTPANIGPVRSLRPYYIDWFLPYNAGIVHAGGSAEALADIGILKLQDMNHNSSHFRRDSKRYAPHNLYTTGQQMLDLFKSKGYSNPTPIPSLPRKAAAPADAPTANGVDINISRSLYAVGFTWDKTTNTYLRNMAGAPHVDAESGIRITPDVVIVPIMSRSTHADRVHTVYGTVGSGKVFIFQDGVVTEGTWTKPSRSAQWQFTDSAGAEIKLNPGQTWFTMVDSPNAVVVKP